MIKKVQLHSTEVAARHAEQNLLSALYHKDGIRSRSERLGIVNGIRQAVGTALDAKWQDQDESWAGIHPTYADIQENIQTFLAARRGLSAATMKIVRAFVVTSGRLHIQQALNEAGGRHRGRNETTEMIARKAAAGLETTAMRAIDDMPPTAGINEEGSGEDSDELDFDSDPFAQPSHLDDLENLD